ncbi:MAG: tRNA (N(6)-L-threonylcarbamoyladenosine(37)-C(2))-methylthiotransferase MtaB [Opitutae bacterium]|nr:tRNA (N(6)-L-threonylcarbamoyladenosine(37)-C(2))-methylthiotransferase MtaB [Opitutae bacterium]
MSKKASVKALGCRLNQYEAVEMQGRLEASGYEIVAFGEKADLGVINTCTVTNEADAKSRNVIRRFIRQNPEALTVVVGCYSQMDANSIAMIKGVDYVIGNHDKMNFLDHVDDIKPSTPVIVRDRISREDFSIGFVGDPQFEQRANLKIQDGCDFMCSFCVIPFSRGRARSRELDDLISEVGRMVQSGVQEIILTGVNLGTYSSKSKNFLNLIEMISAFNGLKRIRISSIEPTTIPEAIFDWMADNSHPLMPYLHVPMQSGSDEILNLMKRKYSLLEMSEFFERAVSKIPKVCIGTDLMVGFPGETNDHFEETCETFMNFPFSYCHVFTFSERKGTAAYRMQKQVRMDERRKRSAHLRRLSSSKRMEFFKKHEGKIVEVLLENPKGNMISGYTDNYVKVLLDKCDLTKPNKLINVKLIETYPEFSKGIVLN